MARSICISRPGAPSTGRSGGRRQWRETYLVKAGEYETLYANMPPYGLGAAGRLVPAKGRMPSAAGRVGRSDGSDRPEGVS